MLTTIEQLHALKRLCVEINAVAGEQCAEMSGPLGVIDVSGTLFDLEARTIKGPVTEQTEIARNQMRRHGIRFRYSHNKEYTPWPAS